MVTYSSPDWFYRSPITYRGDVPFTGTGLPTDATEPTDTRWFTVDGDPVYPQFPDLKFELAFGRNPFDPALVTTPGVWTNITRWVHAPTGCTINRGQSTEFESPQPADASFTIRDLDRTFDPLNSASRFAGFIKPRTPCRISATYSGTTYQLFTGVVDGFPQMYDVADNVTFVAITATDFLSIIARQRWQPAHPAICDDATHGQCDTNNRLGGDDPNLPAQLSGVRVAELLDVLGLPSELVDVDQGQTVLRSGQTGADSIWTHLLDVTSTELGSLYTRGDGVIRWAERSYPAEEPAALFLDQPGWAITYAALELDPYALQDLRNEITRGSAIVDPVTAKDAQSADEFGTVTDERTDLFFAQGGDAAAQARYLLARYARPATRIRAMTVKPARWPEYLWPGVLGWDLGERLVVGRTPLHVGEPFTQTVAIVRISHTFTSTDWTTEYAMTQPDVNLYARCDSTTSGVVDAGYPIAY